MAEPTDGRRARRADLPEATIARLPVYLRALTALAESGVPTASSDQMAGSAGVTSAQVRKDLSYLGSYGIRGVGYEVDYLVHQISRALGLTQDWSVVIVGVGNLGHALANYPGFASRGFRVAALVDADESRVGEKIGALTVQSVSALESLVSQREISIGVIATPAAEAQRTCDRLVAAGIRSILNFAPVLLTVPDGTEVRKVDLAVELQILAFHEQRRVLASEPCYSLAGQR